MTRPVGVAGLLAAAALAGSAHAQRVDTRRTIVPTDDGSVACTFSAIPELELMETGAASPPSAVAAWSPRALDTPSGHRYDLKILFTPLDGSTTEANAVPFGIWANDLGRRKGPFDARLSLDGERDPFPLRTVLNGKRGAGGMLAIAPADASRFIKAISDSKEATLILVRRDHEPSETHHWDVFPFRRIPELLNLVHWRCTSPDRG